MKRYTLSLLLFFLFFNSYSSEPMESFLTQTEEIETKSIHNSFFSKFKIRNAHIVSFEYGRVISKFDYKNSDGERLSNLQGSINNHIGVGWKMHFKTSKLYLLSKLSYNKYGAKGSDQAVGNYYAWDVNYLGVKLGVGYEFFKTKTYFNFPYVSIDPGITINVQASIASDFLVKGTQTINNMVYNVVGVEQFDKPFIFAYGGLGINYYPTKTLSFSLQYTGGRSFSIFKSDTDDTESLNYISHTISLGIVISLPIY